jgi:hypothetical protein
MPVNVENQPLYDAAVKEVGRLKDRQSQIEVEKANALKNLNLEKKANLVTLKALNVLILRMDGVVSSNGKRPKRRRWPASIPTPSVCVIPAKLHNKGVNRKVKSFGLCASHAQRDVKGTLSTEEKEAYDNALYKLGVIG